ncbi:MAG: ABC transporter permease [Alphaproteobacteria bacterium]
MSDKASALAGEAPARAGADDALHDAPVGTLGFTLKLWATRLAVAAGALGFWEWASGTIIDPFWVSSPSQVFERLREWVATGSIWFHLGITLQETIAGFVCGSLVGMSLGFLLGRNEFLGRVLDPFILSIYSLPKVALAPLFILWFGIGMSAKIVLSAVIVFFLVFYNTYAGVRDADQDLIDVVRLMKGKRRHVLMIAVIPSAMVWVFTGLKIAVPYALIGAVVGEMMASNKGLGHLIEGSAGQFDTAGVFAALFVLMIISTTLHELLNRLEPVVLRWKLVNR